MNAAGEPTILVIDDSRTYRSALHSSLTSAGFSVIEAEDGEQGVRLAAQHRPAAMIVDRVLPGMDGGSVIRRVRLDPELRTTPCVLLTSEDDRGAELAALDSGADAFVLKNQDLEVVIARLLALLRASIKPASASTPPPEPKRLLIVDDDDLWLDTMVETLRDEGYRVASARSGEAAIEQLSAQTVDCILLDLLMPGMGGRETCRLIKEVPALRDIPLIILTSLDSRNAMLEAFADGADDFVEKTADQDLLRARVRAQVRRKQYEDENRRVRAEVMERELAKTRAALLEDLQRKNKELEAFAYSVSHDLRAPLRAIDGFSRILEEDYGEQLDSNGREHLVRVRSATKRMGELIDDLLRLSRIGRAELRREEVDLSTLARGVSSALERSSGGRTIALAIEDGLVADADPRMLRLVMENLLANAWKFTSKTSSAAVEVGHKVENGETIYFVRDNGVGFDMAYAGKLFSPFQRLHADADFPGTGIGLATVSRIVDRHGGRIWTDAAPGRGAAFYFTLPKK